MKKHEDKYDITENLFCWSSDIAQERFKSFCNNVLETKIDEVPSEESIFMKQSFSIVFFRNGFIFNDKWFLFYKKYCDEHHDTY